MTVSGSDVCVVIPTRDRWDILRVTLSALGRQDTTGFEVVVVVDGTDQVVPDLSASARGLALRTVQQERTGPGGARNVGAAVTSRSLLLLLGDDMVPTRSLVGRHLDGHRADTGEEVAVLGHVEWHRAVRRTGLIRWIDRSLTQFDFGITDGAEAGWGRFYSCNVSLKRTFFEAAGGFDPQFRFDYEDLDLGFRLAERGLRIRYDRSALVHHLHPYRLDRLRDRYRSRGEAEWLMAKKHDWFRPFFGDLLRDAAGRPPTGRWWPALAAATPETLLRRRGPVAGRIRTGADLWYRQQVAAAYRAGWESAEAAANRIG
ncbi:MAG TPA: glycosyltransferase [Mycobacteriales bacterium]|nr:glycosyltransferase [Mycobacteriales bacterium]